MKKHVQEIQFFDEDDREAIKWAVYQHGGVSTSIYADVNGSNLEKSSYYSKEDNAYCYRGKEEPNHDVVIIGWDDDYGAEHFPEECREMEPLSARTAGENPSRGRGILYLLL